MSVTIFMGSESDLKIMNEAALTLSEFGIQFSMHVVSAHRSPERLIALIKKSILQGTKIIIAGAGGAAHLPGVLASQTFLPVIGVPIQSSNLNIMGGLDALLSIVQMPKGVPVATVALNGAKNAAILATQILALENKILTKKLEDFKYNLSEKFFENINPNSHTNQNNNLSI